MINLSVLQGDSPSEMKLAKVLPICFKHLDYSKQ